jgi:hypothetical protein
MTGIEALVSIVQAVATDSSIAGSRAIRRRFGRRLQRAVRWTAYGDFETALTLARMRLELLTHVHVARLNPLNVPAVFSWSSVIEALDRLAADLNAALSGWRTVRMAADPRTRAAADEALNALAEVMSHVDPGWHRPTRDANYRTGRAKAADRYDRALSEFSRAARADAAPDKVARRNAAAEPVA